MTTDAQSDLAVSAQGHVGHNWFVAQLRPNMRLIAERNLAQQGFETFTPARLETLRKRGRLITETRPLFPGYMFVRFDLDKRGWQSIHATRGVTRLITDPGQRPQPLPEDFMAGLLSRCDARGLMTDDQSLNQGDTVRILSGPFAGILSRIEKLDAQERLHLLIHVMGREVRATLPRNVVDKVPQPIPA